jgi:hypothetical protein
MSERPIDIVEFTLTPQLWHKTPYLVCTIELRNDTSVGKYLFPRLARLEMFDKLVAFAIPTFVSSGSRGGGAWVTTWRGGGMNPVNIYWSKGTSQSLYCCFEMNAMVLNSLSDAFETNDAVPCRFDLELGIFEDLEMMVQRAAPPPGYPRQETILMPKLSQGILAYAARHVKNYEWLEWLKTWGVAIEAIYLPTRLASELRAIKPTMGVGFEWEVISELVKSYQGSMAEAILVTGDEIQAKMAEVIAGAKKELLIMCRAFDKTLLPHVAEAQDRGVVVKVVTVPTQKLKQEKYPEIGRLEEALKEASVKFQVKKNGKQHARVIISECVALVGSGDPDYYGLKVHRNACVYTTNPTVINAAKLFFESVWQESQS